ncbi:hypothetical protein LCGC14_0027770 [marine sediment metagenome]|uniref:Uncharacterized protein n=1 Tax=marine sediment metagenome TaxID=412755 RepID=A0A0F9W1Q1_9ZZZZ|nr:hypothetical protein [Halomonas sp.]HDZ47230.1 hypothetical protein [Halomonas sp.]HEB05821.1 hypothetical protein [Halomonas sp.]
MRNIINSMGVVVVSVALLAGCGDTEEPPRESVATTQPEQAPAPEPQVAEAEVEPIDVTISTDVSLRTDRRLMVEGETNLPDGTQLQIVVEREISRVRWQARTGVEDGVFAAGPFGSGSGLPDGGYMVRVEVAEASVQPQSVQAIIGNQGQHLAGELVRQSRHGLGQVATYSRRFLVGSEPRQTRDQVEVLESPGM